ncbi:MAG: hypothetical protein PUJ12_07520 [Oscillospiraceae bacterium]|nr:hypothetical protein [Oscillospiraceae bacterium]
MDNQDELQELDLEAIMREFHDPSKDLPPEEPEADENTEAAEEAPAEALADAGAEDVPAAPEVPEDETPVPDSMEELDIGQISPEEDAGEEAAADPTATVRIDDISDVHAEAAEDSAAGEEPAAEDGSENPEEPPAQPEKEPIPFSPRAHLRELKTKLIAGPEKRYYELEEVGIGKLQIAILLNLALVALCALGAVLYAMGAVPGNRMRFLAFSQVLAMLISALLGSNALLDGLGDIFHGKFTLNTLMALTFLACCADAVYCLIELRIPCCAAFCLEMTMALWARYHRRSTEMAQMDTLRKAVNRGSIVKSPEYNNKRPGILRGQGDVEDFMDTYNKSSGPEKLQCVYAFISLIASLGISTLAGLLHGPSMAVQILSTSLLVAVPASFFVSLTRPAALLERRLHMVGSVICGWQGVKKLCGKAVIPLRDEDLFPEGSAKLNGVKFYGEHTPDEIVSFTTSLIVEAGGGLVNVFRTLLTSRGGREYPVEEFRNYGSGGIGGIIQGEPVLLGTLDFMQDMGVHIPDGTMVNQAVYAAIDGELSAVVAISYAKMRSSAAGLVSLTVSRRLTPVMLTRDFMLTESFLRSKFSVSTRRMVFPDQQTRDTLTAIQADPEADVLALTTRQDLASYIYTITGSGALRTASRLGATVHLLGGIVGIAIMLVIAYLGSTQLLTPINILLYQLVWMVPGLLITEWTRSV